MPGKLEGFYCTAIYDRANAAANVVGGVDVETMYGADVDLESWNDRANAAGNVVGGVDVETVYGADVDFESWNGINRREWCKEGSTTFPADKDCKRHSVSQWQLLGANPETNYPSSFMDGASSVSCSASRLMTTIGGDMSLKENEATKVKTGYKIYNTVADYDNGTASGSGAGVDFDMILDSGAAALAATALFSSLLLA